MTLLADITAETARARELHGRSFESGTDHLRITIMAEEHGEVARAALDADAADDLYISGTGSLEAAVAARAHLRAELVQVISLAWRWVEQMDGGE